MVGVIEVDRHVVTPKRPALRWHGGKWLLAPWIIGHFPEHRVYVEPFGGAASVLIRKPQSYAEVYNDLDDEVVNLFQIIRDGNRANQLIEAVRHTPFARSEFRAAHSVADDPVERARRLIVRSFMGFGSDSAINLKNNTGFRSDAFRQGTTPARDFANFPVAMPSLIERFAGVIIESRPALQILKQYDSDETLFYCDPPYVHSTRSSKTNGTSRQHGYAHEMSDRQHVELLKALCGLEAMVVLSGYPNEIYEDLLADWCRVEREALADGARKRCEVLWINRAAMDAGACATDLVEQGDMFQ